MSDRYGPLHPSLVRLAEYGRARVRASRLGVEAIDREASRLVIRFGGDTRIDPGRLVDLVRSRPGLALTPAGVLRLDLDAARDAGDPQSAGNRPGAGGSPAVGGDLDLLARVNAWLDDLGDVR